LFIFAETNTNANMNGTKDGLGVRPWILFLFPVVYFINNLMPWSYGLWIDNNHDYYIPFWSSIIVTHVIGVLLAFWIVRKCGLTMQGIGINLNIRKISVLLTILCVIGAGMAYFTHNLVSGMEISEEQLNSAYFYVPQTDIERIFWIICCLFAGFCEEFYFRGCIQGLLKKKNYHWSLVIIISTISFCLIHSGAFLESWTNVSSYVAFGLFFGGLYMWTKKLWLNIAIHSIYDMFLMMAILNG